MDDLPRFTINDIELHRLNSGKTPELAITKTLDRGRKFKEERYISSDYIFTHADENYFYIKGQCKASMRPEKRRLFARLNRLTCEVENAYCSCPAGKSGYCNHVMALLLEIAEYSLKGHKRVPEEVACTSQMRAWGIPGVASSFRKAPVQETTIQKSISNRGISSTLYDPRNRDEPEELVLERLQQMQKELQDDDKNITWDLLFFEYFYRITQAVTNN